MLSQSKTARRDGDFGRIQTPKLLIRSQFTTQNLLYYDDLGSLYIFSEYNYLLCEAISFCKIDCILSLPVL